MVKFGDVERFMYLGSVLQRDMGFEIYMKHMIKFRWILWEEMLCILCDKRIPVGLKYKFYEALVRPTMMYESLSGGR